MSDSVALYLGEIQIDGDSYGFNLPSKSYEDAEASFAKLGGRVLGSKVCEMSCIPAPQLMDFCNACAEEPIKWRFNACEHLEAFLAMGWPAEPEKL